MSSILDQPELRQVVLPITVEQYHRLGEAGIIAEKTELVRGVIFEKMIKSPRHTWLVERLADWLREAVPAGFCVRQEQPLTLADSEPEPDVAVVSGSTDDYREAHPRTARLVIEVAIGSVALDREKGDAYAAAGVPEYWLVLPDEKTVEVYTEPSEAGYGKRRICPEPDTLPVEGFPGLALDIGGLFS
jgi:Uma2 family endonuclease